MLFKFKAIRKELDVTTITNISFLIPVGGPLTCVISSVQGEDLTIAITEETNTDFVDFKRFTELLQSDLMDLHRQFSRVGKFGVDMCQRIDDLFYNV